MRKIFVFVFVVFQGVICSSAYSSTSVTGIRTDVRCGCVDTSVSFELSQPSLFRGATTIDNHTVVNTTNIVNNVTNIYNDDTEYSVYVCRALSEKILYKWYTNTLKAGYVGKRGLDYVKLNNSLHTHKNDIYVKERLGKAIRKFSNGTTTANYTELL